MAIESDSTDRARMQSQNPLTDQRNIAAFDKAIRRSHIQGTIDGVDMAFNVLEESLPLTLKSIRDALTEELRGQLSALDETEGGAS